MKYAFTGLLSTGALCAVLLATPAVAQVAGNPGDLHTPTVYSNQVRGEVSGYNPGAAGPFGAVGSLITAPITAPVAAFSGSGYGGGRCGVDQDFNGRYTALCGL